MPCCNDEASFERMRTRLELELEASLADVEPGERKEWLTWLRLEQERNAKPPATLTTAARTFLRRGR